MKAHIIHGLLLLLLSPGCILADQVATLPQARAGQLQPVALPNLMQVVWATVNRTSRSGDVIGPDERVTALEAMKMITLWSAEQFGEQASKGSLEPGKLADMVIVSENPLTIDPMKINSIVVVETIKEGRTVFRRES